MVRPLLAVAALLTTLTTAPAKPLTVRDTTGRAWTVLSPAAHQMDLLFFVSTDCPISNRYAPEIQRICGEYRGKGVRCFLVYPDSATDAAAVSAHQHTYGFDAAMPAIIDREHALVVATGASVTPQAVLYSTTGRVYSGRIDDLYVDVGRSRRAATRHDVRLALDATVVGRSVAQPETEAVGCAIATP